MIEDSFFSQPSFEIGERFSDTLFLLKAAHAERMDSADLNREQYEKQEQLADSFSKEMKQLPEQQKNQPFIVHRPAVSLNPSPSTLSAPSDSTLGVHPTAAAFVSICVVLCSVYVMFRVRKALKNDKTVASKKEE